LLRRRYSSAVFSLSVRLEKRPLFAQQSVLSQSPILSRFCQPGFKESEVKHIGLSADEADVFDRLPEYLYACVYGTAFTETYNLTDELVSIYILAEKYELEHHTILTIRKLQNVNWVSRTSTAFFAISQRIYTNTLSSA